MSEGHNQWKIEVNDRLCAVVDVLLGLATGALVLPIVFLRTFLGVPEFQPLGPLLRESAYVAVVAFSLSIFLGIVFRYTSAKWVKQALGQPTKLGPVGMERILDWSFWVMVVAFFVGVASFVCFAHDGQGVKHATPEDGAAAPRSHLESRSDRGWDECRLGMHAKEHTHEPGV